MLIAVCFLDYFKHFRDLKHVRQEDLTCVSF